MDWECWHACGEAAAVAAEAGAGGSESAAEGAGAHPYQHLPYASLLLVRGTHEELGAGQHLLRQGACARRSRPQAVYRPDGVQVCLSQLSSLMMKFPPSFFLASDIRFGMLFYTGSCDKPGPNYYISYSNIVCHGTWFRKALESEIDKFSS